MWTWTRSKLKCNNVSFSPFGLDLGPDFQVWKHPESQWILQHFLLLISKTQSESKCFILMKGKGERGEVVSVFISVFPVIGTELCSSFLKISNIIILAIPLKHYKESTWFTGHNHNVGLHLQLRTVWNEQKKEIAVKINIFCVLLSILMSISRLLNTERPFLMW